MAFWSFRRPMARRLRPVPSHWLPANCARALSTTTCSAAASAAAPMTGFSVRASLSRPFRRSRRRSCRPSCRRSAAGRATRRAAGRATRDEPAARSAAEPVAARRLSDHRAGARHLWGGAASGAPVGSRHPRHARRPGRRHLPARLLRGAPAPETTGVDLPTRKSLPTKKAAAAPVPAFLALGLGPLLRPDARQPLRRVRRSARQRQSGRLPGRHRPSARLV